MTLRAGQTLGKYRLIGLIGQGGMATVYKAYQPGLDRYVALKVMRPDMVDEEEFVARFQREASAIARLRHPHIVQVYDLEVVDQFYFMVMEFIDGPTLKAEARTRQRQNQPFSLAEIVRIFTDLADAIDYAHSRGMIHRDLKPTNVLINRAGEVVLTDFGVARIMGAIGLTTSGAMIGTPAYMSPEQGRGESGDERSDIYSLGVILYELVTGQIPFDGDTPYAVVMKHVHTPPPRPGQLNPTLPRAVEDVILNALSKEPAARYQQAGLMATALRQATGFAASDPFILEPLTTLTASPVVSRADKLRDDITLPPDLPPAMVQPSRPPVQGQPAASKAPPAEEPKLKSRPWLLPLVYGISALLFICLIGLTIFIFFSRQGRLSGVAVSDPPTARSTGTPTVNRDEQVTPTGSGNAVSPTLTSTPSPTSTSSPSPTAVSTATPTLLPVLGQNCPDKPNELFAAIWDQYRSLLGCPTSALNVIPTLAEEAFEGGHLFWRSDTDQVYIVYDRDKASGRDVLMGEWFTNPDWKWDNSDPDGIGLSPPAGLVEPKRGFGWLWRTHLDRENGRLGWALDREYGFDNLGQAQAFEAGTMFKGSGPRIYILLDNGRFEAQP